MKNLLRIIVSLSLLCSIGQLYAQESNYIRQPGYWTLGLNGGLAYQSSDIRTTLEGWGVGATLAKNLYYRPGAALTFDLRGRLLYDQSYGIDHFRSTGISNNPRLSSYLTENGGDGFVFQNNKTHHGELGLEGVIGFNRLREKTNINLALFGGIGLGYYATYMDQKNGNGTIYDYSSSTIDLNENRQGIKAQLNSIMDGRYESKAEGFGSAGQLAFMPGLGVELGYQLTPRFSIGLGHKVTFTRTDLFDGQQWNDDNRVTGNNDLHHYTNLHLRWILDAKKDKIKPPMIELLTPNDNPHTTTNDLALIKARIKYINSSMDIDYKVNGKSTGFDFNKEILTNDFYLRPGRNVVDITATNSAGSDKERVIIYYKEPHGGPAPPPTTNTVRDPRVNFTNPSKNPEYVSLERYTVTATVLNVDRKRDITFEVDGRQVSDFSFDSRRDRFTANIRLKPGKNRLRITVCNAAGVTDRDEGSVVLERQQSNEERPVVDITSPSSDPHNTDQNRVQIRADIFNVNEKLDVSFEVNGNRVRNFSFSNNKFSATANLRTGRNVVKVTGKNKVGQDSDQVVINYNVDEPANPPTVTITSISQPTTDPFNPNQCKIRINAKVTNVDGKNNISYRLDGQTFNDFSYNPDTEELTSVITVNTGNHNVVIKATNDAGSDQDDATVTSCNGGTNGGGGDAPVVDITSPNNGSTTNKPTAVIKASLDNVVNNGNINFKVNGRRITKFSYSRGRFDATVSLKEGNNQIEITGSNDHGNDSDNISINYKRDVEVPKRPPVVSINKPSNNSTVNENSVNLEGKVENVFEKRDIEVLLNGKKISNFSFASRGGRLTAKVTGLRTGSNKITIKAKNNDGRDEASVNVSYKIAVTPPKVSITSPRGGMTTDKSSISVKANISNVDSKKDVSLKVNGKSITKFNYSRGSLTATVPLKEGSNRIFVEGSNKAGKANDEVRVTYKKAVALPKVTITSPRNGTTTDKTSAAITSTIANVQSKKDVNLTVNGKSVTKFSFSRGKLTATVSLREGKNKVTVKGKNASGSDTDDVNITYKKKVTKAPPRIGSFTLSQPTVDPTNPTSAKSSATATLVNITKKGQIKFYFNNRQSNDFTFDKKTKKFKAIVNLTRGVNYVKIVATNKDGQKEEVKTITF